MVDKVIEKGKEMKLVDVPMDIPKVVGLHIADVMRDRKAMLSMEADLDKFIQTIPKEEQQAKKQEWKQQLENGRMAIESLTHRMLSS